MASARQEIRRIAVGVVGWAAWLGLTLLWGLLVVPLTLLLKPFWPGVRSQFSSLTRRALHAYVSRLPFARIRVEGVEKRLQGPRILVANHQSRLDSPVMLSIEPRLSGPVRSYMLKVPFIGSAIRLLGFFDADESVAGTLDAMHSAAEQARANDGGLIFYPEGTRSATGEIGAFRRGAFRLAVDHDLPIQPLVIEGLDRVFPPGHVMSPVHDRQLVRICYLEPVYPPYGAGPRREVVRALAERVRGSMIEELSRLRAERRASR